MSLVSQKDHGELDALEEIASRACAAGIEFDELPELDQLHVTEIVAAATRRQLAGEPPA